jgi:hypothetical protein
MPRLLTAAGLAASAAASLIAMPTAAHAATVAYTMQLCLTGSAGSEYATEDVANTAPGTNASNQYFATGLSNGTNCSDKFTPNPGGWLISAVGTSNIENPNYPGNFRPVQFDHFEVDSPDFTGTAIIFAPYAHVNVPKPFTNTDTPNILVNAIFS